MSQWIWKFGEYEIYHNMLLHSRRQHYGYKRPPMWKLHTSDPVVGFQKKVTTEGGKVRITACGDVFTSVQTGPMPWDNMEIGGKREFDLPAGTVTVKILVNNIQTFPCIYVDGVIESDETWSACDNTSDWGPVGSDAIFTDPEQTPEIFPFAYEPISYVKKEEIQDGVLFDFGKETFARTKISGLSGKDSAVIVRFGESREEALDAEWSVIRFKECPINGILEYMPYAFRYIYVSEKQAEIEAEYEYLPVTYRGSFHSSNEMLNRIWDVAAYTFHLNSREFILDGIKRDGWVWSADAYQSFFVNQYLFFDQDLVKRTLIALGGKQPMKQHINTIVDYTFFWLISLWDYYTTYGDAAFLKNMAPQAEEIINYCLGRADADGFMRGKEGDWIFIDWAPMDKTGALCGEQILFAKAMECYSKICEITGMDSKNCAEKAAALHAAILEKFYDEEKQVFIDSYESGNRNVTRHSNILAYLFLPCSEEIKKNIYEKVVLNDEIKQITTPYFKFYENQVHCLAGFPEKLEETIETYYGSMLETGATTLYEEFDPNMKGAEHYAMYGRPFEKSLCHAWSASPIYLMGRFRLGVRNTGIAYETFEVEPVLGNLRELSGIVPVPGGTVSVSVTPEEIRVKADISGGTLIVKDRKYIIEPGKELYVKQ